MIGSGRKVLLSPVFLLPQTIDAVMREKVARVRNSIIALARRSLSIYDASIIYTYEDSAELPVADMLKHENIMASTARAFTLCSR